MLNRHVGTLDLFLLHLITPVYKIGCMATRIEYTIMCEYLLKDSQDNFYYHGLYCIRVIRLMRESKIKKVQTNLFRLDLIICKN